MGSDFQSIPIIGILPGTRSLMIVETLQSCDGIIFRLAIHPYADKIRDHLLDIAPFLDKLNDPKMAEDEEVLKVVRELDKACKEAGFFYLKGHGIPDSMIQEVREVTRKFFGLPYDQKCKIKMSSESGYRGYQRIGVNVTKGKPDMHEAIDCYREIAPGTYGALGTVLEGTNLWPDTPSNFKLLMEEYISLLRELSRKIMRGIALALGGEPEAFEGDRAGDSFWVTRIIGYPGSTEISPEAQHSDVGCGAHTDYGLLTLVNQDDDIHALQVRNQSGEWISAPPVPGAFVCNIGDMLKIWSNGIYESTLHRVINNSPKYRVSVAFFYEPNFDARAEPFDFCVQKSGGTAKFEGAVYGEHLNKKVQTNFG